MSLLWFGAQSRGRRSRAATGFSLALCCLTLVIVFAVAAGQVSASERYGAIVVDARTGQVLHEVNADRRHYPASLTKMMTLYLLFEAVQRGRLSLYSQLPVSAQAARQPPSKVGVRAGDTIMVDTAIRALAVKSGNDVAVVVAEALGGSESAFARQMTRKARELGMWRTTFFNASGLPNSLQLSTPRDMAQLSRALLYDFPQYYHYFSTQSFTYKGKRFNTHNRILNSFAGADGIKTGYTSKAGYNISASALRNGRRLIAIVFGADSSRARNNQAEYLLDAAFRGRVPSAPSVQTTQTASRSRQQDYGSANAANSRDAAVQRSRQVSSNVQSAQTRSGSSGRWSVQIGAFSRDATAKAVARQAQSLSGQLSSGRIYVIPVMSSTSGTLYRSRIAGLSESVARAACEDLRRRNADCRVVPPGG